MNIYTNKFLKNIWTWAVMWLWIILSIWLIGSVYAYTNLPTATSWDSLTETIWNDLINSVNDIWTRTDNIFSVGWNIWIWEATPGAKLHVAWDLKVDWNRIIRKSVVQVNSTTYNVGTSWTLWPTFSNITDFKAGSLVKLSYNIPMRNDSISWGGWYIEPQISFDWWSSWNSLWSSWYDGWVMNNTSPSIGSYYNTILVDPAQVSDFTVTVRFYFKSYDGTVKVNGNNNINAISGVAPLMTWVNGLQHYSKIIVEELY